MRLWGGAALEGCRAFSPDLSTCPGGALSSLLIRQCARAVSARAPETHSTELLFDSTPVILEADS